MSEFDTKEYDADQVFVSFGGVQLSKGAGASGYAEGIFITIEPEGDIFDDVAGTDGTVTRSKTNERRFTATLRTMQSNSSTNGYLSTVMQEDESLPNGAGILALVVQDLQGTTIFEASKAWVKAWPKQDFDRNAKEREWVFRGVRNNIFVGGN